MRSGELFDILRLREIGWAHWDPIGLSGSREKCPDEYDNYLMQAAGLALRNIPEEGVADYLQSCCHEMGVAANERAAITTARAIMSEVSGATSIAAGEAQRA